MEDRLLLIACILTLFMPDFGLFKHFIKKITVIEQLSTSKFTKIGKKFFDLHTCVLINPHARF